MPIDWMPRYEKKLAEKQDVDAFVEFILADDTPTAPAAASAHRIAAPDHRASRADPSATRRAQRTPLGRSISATHWLQGTHPLVRAEPAR